MADTSRIPAIEIALRTDPGRDPEKQVNEDSGGQRETRFGLLAVVCDGMGGHAGGKEASELALETILDRVQNAREDATARDALREAIEEANRRVYAMPTAEHGLRPGSTVVAVLAHTNGAEVAHVGDSRVYLVHGGAIAQVTKDHSMVQEMVDRNLIRAEDAATHPDANKIMRALGIAPECEVDLRPEPIAYVAGDVFVLCSDGLSDLVAAGEILNVAGSQPPAQAAGQLVDLANARGGHDNITTMLLRMKTAAIASPESQGTLVKTVALTQALAPAEGAGGAGAGGAGGGDAGSGPRGTLVAGPAGTAGAPAAAGSSPNVGGAPGAAHGAQVLPVTIPSAPEPPSSRGGARSRAPVIVGIGLAVAAVAIVGVLVWSQTRPQRRSVPIVPNATAADAGVAPPPLGHEVDAEAPAVVAPVPPLEEPPVCAKARSARARHSPATRILEEQCRAAGGVIAPEPGSAPDAPGAATGAPPGAATPAPTPTPPPAQPTAPLPTPPALPTSVPPLPTAPTTKATPGASAGVNR
jgi:serine/threonine protein phosphatase PrpC